MLGKFGKSQGKLGKVSHDALVVGVPPNRIGKIMQFSGSEFFAEGTVPAIVR